MAKRDSRQLLHPVKALADGDAIEALFQAILGRPVNDDPFKAEMANRSTITDWAHRLANSEEFKQRVLKEHGIAGKAAGFLADEDFRNPHFGPLDVPSSILLIGSCMTQGWARMLREAYPEMTVRHQLFNNASELEDLSDAQIGQSPFQIVQMPLRSMLPEVEYFNTEGAEAMEAVFAGSVAQLRRNLDAALKYNRQTGIPTFVLNFAVPQRNPLGILLPRYDFRDLRYFVSELNRKLYEMIAAETGVFMIDFDEITSMIGKRYVMDDVIFNTAHGSFISAELTDRDIDLTPLGDAATIFNPKIQSTVLATFRECLAAYVTTSPASKIKLVIFDLDGTLWRGVAAEHDELDEHLTEGWPIGIVEAASFLKKRGILLAIASKNDRANVDHIWRNLYGNRFPLSNFAVTKISWDPKVRAIGEILAETNLLPGNCLFVDDNPLEREQVKLAYPDMHIIDGPILSWRRQLLWGVETQVPYVTAESASRTQSIQSMIQREALKTEANEEDYLASLEITVKIGTITGRDHPRFSRAFELLNKTNQFNLTGQRFTEAEIAAILAEGGSLLTADVSDRLSSYGLTAVMLVRGGECLQFVMSCRVFGLRVEFALFDRFLSQATALERRVSYVRTAKNGPARKFFEKLGLDLQGLDTEGDMRSFPLSPDYTLPSTLYEVVAIHED